jgi:hypothetical protein
MREKSTTDMENYLREQEEWVIMVLKQSNVLKAIRFDEIVEYMMLVDDKIRPRKYFLIQRHYAEHFREKYINNLCNCRRNWKPGRVTIMLRGK